MLNTLLKIGDWQSKGKGEWDRFLEKPKIEREDKKGNRITNYSLPVIFDLDEMEVVIDAANLKEYDDENDYKKLKALKIQGGNNKSIYSCVPAGKLIQIYKTFFGRTGNDNIKEGELCEAIKKDFPAYKSSVLFEILTKVFLLKEKFLLKTMDPVKQAIDPKHITKELDLSNNENISLIYICVKSKEFGIQEPTPFSEIKDYTSLLHDKFIGDPCNENTKPDEEKLCYASGLLEKRVGEVDLPNRYSLNKMFVTETKNYASQFNINRFRINYQVSRDNQEKLDFASNFLLQKYNVSIAGLKHVIIPQFMSSDILDYDIILGGIKKKSDILFSLVDLDDMAGNVELETNQAFWINFMAFESDGNFFKTTSLIKDVSHFHFSKVIHSFNEVSWKFRNSNYINWDPVMTEYGKIRGFNLNTVYGLIPIRKDKEKKNIALELFKSILENRKVNIFHLFKFFSELILCHYFERYNSYTNIQKSSKDYFGKTVRNSVFKYLAFILVLKKLNLIDMDTENQNTTSDVEGNEYEKAIQQFFAKMSFNQNQKAMFFLGRMLNSVAYMQKDKNKTVIDKVNYNGMDRDDIVRLRISLFEKAKQYGKSRKIVFTDNAFAENFDFVNWVMDPNEAVFFLLSGYSFGIKPQENNIYIEIND